MEILKYFQVQGYALYLLHTDRVMGLRTGGGWKTHTGHELTIVNLNYGSISFLCHSATFVYIRNVPL